MVTNDVMKMATTCSVTGAHNVLLSVMIGNLFDIIIVAATDNDL